MIHNSKLGYYKPLFILAFDHRASFQKKMFGITGEPSSEQVKEIISFKQVIYEGFKQGVANGVPKNEAAILVDEQFGDAILRDAVANGFTACVGTEKSGQDEFDFQYGRDEFAAHIEKYKTQIVKVLIRYNPESDPGMNARQRGRLKILSDWCHANGYKFLTEPLIPASESQLASVGGDAKRYDSETRPMLMVKMIEELQGDGVEPDIWKIEGLEDTSHYEEVMKQARSGDRDKVAAVVLGRGADAAQVEKWLRAGAKVEGLVGFAIGRTIFWDPLVAMKDGKMSRGEAVKQIATNYKHFYEVFKKAK